MKKCEFQPFINPAQTGFFSTANCPFLKNNEKAGVTGEKNH